MNRMKLNGFLLPKDRRHAARRCAGLKKSGGGPQGSRKGNEDDLGIAYLCMVGR